MPGLNREPCVGRVPAGKSRWYYWFGHTTSLTPHLVPNCEVKSGQATSSTVLGDYTGTGCAERFFFLPFVLFSNARSWSVRHRACQPSFMSTHWSHVGRIKHCIALTEVVKPSAGLIHPATGYNHHCYLQLHPPTQYCNKKCLIIYLVIILMWPCVCTNCQVKTLDETANRRFSRIILTLH